MKQILLLLLLSPCLCLAQYTGNANQKITLGEQTTADGLVYRGVGNDTANITPLSDTSAYIILDTVNNKFYNYNRTTNVWSVAGGGTAVTSVATGLGLSGGPITSTGTILVDTASASIISRQRATNTFLTPTGSAANLTSFPTLNQNTTGSAATLTTGRTVQTNLATTSAATFNGSANITPGVTGVLPLANGGTGSLSKNFVDLTTAQTVVGLKTFNANSITVKSTAATGLATLVFFDSNGNFKGQFGYGSSQTNELDFYQGLNAAVRYWISTYNTDRIMIKIDTNFRVGINDNITPTQTLDVNGGARIRGLANNNNPVNVQATSDGTLALTSSINIKEDVQNLPYGLNEIMLLQPSKFSYIDKYKYGEGYDIGFIAEDVINVIPESVGTGVESDVFMDSVKLIPVLVKAIQEQQALIKALGQRLLILENK